MPRNSLPASPDRPQRQRVRDELGLPKTLPAGAQDFLPLCGQGPELLLLGLGPEPKALPQLFPDAASVRYLEAPELAAQLGPDWQARIPAGYAALTPQELPETARHARVVLYRPGPRLFPSFWGPLLARLQLAQLAQLPIATSKLVWLPGQEHDLLRVELSEAFAALGWNVRVVPGEAAIRGLLAQGECPELYLSVNFRGLDPLGEAAYLLQAAGARVAVWCVDNPLHLVSGLKSRFWTALPLFVTDDWFLEPLRGLGAQQVLHLPLAARTAQLEALPEPSPHWADLAQRLVFVGRSAFPGKTDFFAGCTVPDAAWTEAERLLDEGSRPDFGWWLKRLGIETLWPGQAVRRGGFCAEETGQAWRTRCLSAAQRDLGGALTVFGDDGWQALLPPGTDVRGPVDYYTVLPKIYASALCCLNLTSPLLPHGLTQRHFDVWACGGLLLSDATPGLSLFPEALTREIAFRSTSELLSRYNGLTKDRTLRRDLIAAWRTELCARHSYAVRLHRLLSALKLS